MNSVIVGSNPRIVSFYGAFFDMLGIEYESYNSISIGIKRAILNRNVVNILVVLENRDDLSVYLRMKDSIDTSTTNIFIVCVDDSFIPTISKNKLIAFSHKMITSDFADVLSGAGACKPYLKDLGSRRSPDGILEHIKFMLSNGHVTLPVDNECAVRVIKALDSDNVSFKEVDDMTRIDPALHSGILRMANSVYYSGSYGDVNDVQKALVRIGISNVKAYLVNFINKSIASNKNLLFKDEIAACVADSQIIAVCAYVMSQFFKVCNNAQMFSIGILSKLGEIFILAIISDYLAEENAEDVRSLGYLEIASDNNIMVGSSLMKKWRFSDDYFVPLLFCETLKDNPFMNEARILHLAVHMTNYFKTGEVDEFLQTALDKTQIPLSEKQLMKIRVEAVKKHKEFTMIF